jgi:hypothetical protein
MSDQCKPGEEKMTACLELPAMGGAIGFRNAAGKLTTFGSSDRNFFRDPPSPLIRRSVGLSTGRSGEC